MNERPMPPHAQRGATMAEAGLIIALIALVSIGAIRSLGNNAGSLEAANEGIEQPDMAMIDQNSGEVVTGTPTYTGGSSGSSGGSGSVLGVTGAAIQGVEVEDRGFEDGENRNWYNYSAGQTIGAWTVISGNVDTHSTTAYSNGVGERFIDLNGFGPGAISQTVGVVPGVAYKLSVTVSENQCQEAVKSMQIEWNGAVVSQLEVDLPRGEFRTYEVQLPASATGSAELVFRGTSDRNCGVQIDEPSLELVIA